jgi:hypothetical protein
MRRIFSDEVMAERRRAAPPCRAQGPGLRVTYDPTSMRGESTTPRHNVASRFSFLASHQPLGIFSVLGRRSSPCDYYSFFFTIIHSRTHRHGKSHILAQDGSHHHVWLHSGLRLFCSRPAALLDRVPSPHPTSRPLIVSPHPPPTSRR